MEPLKKYYASISTLGNTLLEKEKRLTALEEIEKQLNREFNAEKSHLKKPDTSIFNSFTNIENLFGTLFNNLETCNETSQFFLNVLCLACKHLLKKLTVELQIKTCDVCLNLAEKAFTEKNWLLLEKCFKCFKLFEHREWNNVLLYEQQRNRILKIINSSVSVGKDCLSSKTKQEFAALQILGVEVFNNIVETELFKKDAILKPTECFMLLFPLLFDENCELRKVAYRTFVFLKKQCPDVCSQLLVNCPSLREQLKLLYSKKLAHFVRTNELDWVDLWCFMVELLGQECTARKNTDLINNLLQAEEIGFRSSNMNTRYSAFVGWKFLVNRFLDTSLEDSSRRLKLLMQPLITSNSKTTDILCIKFDIWWQLIMGIEPCIQRHVTNILYHFLNFCFGPVSDGSSVNNVCTSSDIPDTLASRRPAISNVTNYPIVTTRRWKGLEVNRTDALAQILSLNDCPNKEFKLQHFKTPVISTPQTFLCLSKMLIHCVGECTILSIDCKEMSSQERKFYLRDIWKNLLLHVRKVYEIPTSVSSNIGQDACEKQEKTEMMKNMFRILLRLNEMALNNQNLANVCLNPVLETILSIENGLPDEVLTSRNYYVGTDVMMGTPLSIILDMFLSPAFLSIRTPAEENKPTTDVLYMVLLQRVVHLGVGSSENAILFTQTVMKRIDAVVSNISVEGNKVKSIWIMLARILTSSYVGVGRDINQGTEEKADFSWLMAVLMFPVIYSKIFLTDQDMILRIWGQLNQALLRNISCNIQSVKGNEVCCIICTKVQQEISRKKNIRSDELLHIMCLVTCAIEQIPFVTLNKVLRGYASESEKLGHLQPCFQVLQTSVEIPKLKVEDNMYIPIVTQYAKCYQVFCDNLRGCPVQFLTLFFIEQIQFILSIKLESKDTPSSRLFSSTCIRTWKSFLFVLLSGCLRSLQQRKQTTVKMIQPVLLSSFNHVDHTIHEITINFSMTENINLQTNYECNKCRIMQQRMSPGRTSLFPPDSSSEVNNDDKLKDLLSRPLTKHQREAFRQRRDDIPALYQDLTQDSQPSFSDSQDLSQMLTANAEIECDEAASIGESVSIPRVSSFQSKENSSPAPKENTSLPSTGDLETSSKHLLADSTDDSVKETNHIEIVKCSNKAVTPKDTNQHIAVSEVSVIKSPEMRTSQQSQNEKRVADTTPRSQKTSLVMKPTSRTDLGRTINTLLMTSVKKSSDPEGKKLNNESFCSLSNIVKAAKFNEGHAVTTRTVKVCKSELKNVYPGVKRIIIKLPLMSGKNSIKESKLTIAENCSDVLCKKYVTHPKASNCDESRSASLHVEPNASRTFENAIKSNTIEDVSNTSELTKNGSASVEHQEIPAQKEQNTNVISCHSAVNLNDHSESKIKSSPSSKDPTFEETSKCNVQSPVKPIENDPKMSSPNGNKMISPARVVLKRLEMNDVSDYSCRALLFKDQEHSKSEIVSTEILDKHKIESGNSELNSSTLKDLKPSSNLLSCDKDLLSEKLMSTNVEVKEPEKESKEKQSILTFFPKEAKSKSNVSQMEVVESALPEDHQTISTPSYQTRAKALKLYHFTRSYEKRKSANKSEENQRKSSPKENLIVAEGFSPKKIETVEMVNQRQSKALKTVQNNQHNASSPYMSINKSDNESPTSSVTNSKHNKEGKTKENILERNCSPLINHHTVTENTHTDSKLQLVNLIQNSEKKLSCEGTDDECNQVKPKGVCGGERQQQESVEGKSSTSSPKTSQNKIEAASSAEVLCTKECEKQESTKISVECVPETGKSKKKERVIGDCSEDLESTEQIQDAKSDCPKSITHYFSVIPVPGLSIPSNENLEKESSTKRSFCSINSKCDGNGDHIRSKPSQTSVCESVDGMLRNSPDKCKNDLNEAITSADPKISCNGEVSSQISCDKGEYVRSLSLMPQNANSIIQPKTHKISTRSDWARRFGCKSEVDLSKNTDSSEKDVDENTDTSSDLTGSIDSLDLQDIVESSQDKKVVFKDCFISLPKLSITPDCVLNGIDGSLLVSEEISSGLFRVINKTCKEGHDDRVESSLEDTEKIEELKTSLCITTNEITESTAQKNIDLMQEASAVDSLPAEINRCDLSVRNENGEIKDACKPNDSTQVVEDEGKDITQCSSELCDLKPKEKEVIDLTLDNEIDAEGENADIKSYVLANTLSGTENTKSIPEELDKDEKRKRKRNDEIWKKFAKRRRIMQPSSINEYNECIEESVGSSENDSLGVISTEIPEFESTLQNNEEIEKSSPSKFAVGAALLNGSPIKIKRSKHLVRSEDSSPSHKHMSGRAAQLVDVALTKKSININIDPTPSTSSDVGFEESNHDVVFTFNAEGEEETSPWVRSSPQSEASPGKTNLKRKLPVDECASETPPSKKSVRLSDPEVTRKLHFQKIESPEKTTFRIVRTKKGKLYVQKNTSATKDRQHRVDRSTESKPVWPTLKDCTSPVTDVIEQLAVVGSKCKDRLISTLESRNISTIGELCSLSESEIEELPIKVPKVIVFKLVMQAYEDRMKNIQSYKAIRQQRLQKESSTGDVATYLKTHLSSLSPDAVINLLKESLSETDMKVVATNFNKSVLPSLSKSVGIATELEMQDKASSTDEDVSQQLGYFLPEALKKQVDQNEQKKIIIQVLQILFHHCSVPHILEEVREVVSDSNFEPPNGSDKVNVTAVNQCFKLLQFLCTQSALPLDSARELYQDTIRQFGVHSVLSEILKCGESEHESPVFLKEIMNCLKTQLCDKKETAANVFQCLITDNTLPFAIQHFTANQLVPHLVNQCGDQNVLDTVLMGSSMTKERALESLRKYFSSGDAEETNWINTVFKLMSVNSIAKNKCNNVLSILNNLIDLMECE